MSSASLWYLSVGLGLGNEVLILIVCDLSVPDGSAAGPRDATCISRQRTRCCETKIELIRSCDEGRVELGLINSHC
jgi:hypothetical protein